MSKIWIGKNRITASKAVCDGCGGKDFTKRGKDAIFRCSRCHPDVVVDAKIRRVSALSDREQAVAYRQGLNDDDLVYVRTFIGKPPRYEIIKIFGSPTQFLYDRTFGKGAK